MNYKNFFVYVQRQIDRLFRSFRAFAKTYVNDIVVHLNILQKHLVHFKQIFDMLKINNIFIKSKKIFIDYFIVHLLNQKIDFLELIIVEKKLKIISRLFFSTILQLLKTYLNFTSWLRNYVLWYVEMFKSFQKLKIELFHDESVIDNVRKIYSRNTKIKNLTIEKLVFFQTLQFLLAKFFYFVHSNFRRKLYVDLDASKKFELADMIYHVKNSVKWNDKEYSSKKVIEFILFFSRFLTNAKTKYWLIELEFADIVWMLKKIKHLIDFSKQRLIIIFTNHDAILDIAKQINMITVFIDKLNLRFVRVFDYIQRFDVELRHKSNKQHIVFDAFFRLVSFNIDVTFEEDEFDVFFTTTLMKIEKDFRKKFVANYINDLNWKKICSMLNQQNKNDENVVKFSFYRETNKLIFRFDDFIIDNHVYEFHRLCIFHSIIQNILIVVHDDNHSNFARCYKKITTFYYIRDLFKYFKDFFKHCSKCQTYQTRRHKLYDSLQFIFISNIFFHIIIIDFILILSKSRVDQFDCVMSINCKYFKRIVLISNKNTWTIAQWNHVLLNRLDITDWKLSKAIISNRDKKFLSNMWIVMFIKLRIKFLYSVVYHFQTNDLSKRINQIVEIVFRFLIFTLKYFDFWFDVLSQIQRDFNNSISIDNFSNEIVYDFISVQIIDLIKFIDVDIFEFTLKKRRFIIRQNVNNVIIFNQMNAKFHYDKKHQFMFMKQKNVAFIKLHKNYNIFSIINKKYDQQFVEFFTIIEKIDRLIYRLNIFNNWFIHSIFNVIQLKKCSFSSIDFFKRFKSNHFDFVFVNDDTINVKFFELLRIINKRIIKKRNVEYFVKWKNYESKYDVWRNFSKFENATNLINDYETIMNQIILSNRLVLSSSISKIKEKSSMSSTFSVKAIFSKYFESISQIILFFKQNFVVVISFKISLINFVVISISLIKSVDQITNFFNIVGFFNVLIRRFSRFNWKIWYEYEIWMIIWLWITSNRMLIFFYWNKLLWIDIMIRIWKQSNK